MTAETVPSRRPNAARTTARAASPAAAPLPYRSPADPSDETERLCDWGLLASVLAALTADEPERCRGVLVAHADGRVECVEGLRCPADPVMHAGTATCAEALGDCC